MTAKLHLVAIASTLLLSAFSAHAAERTAERAKSVSCITPNYPSAWVEDEVQGTVRLSVLVAPDGSVKDAKVVESSGRRVLDRASLHASSNCKFETLSNGSDSATGGTSLEFKWVAE